MSAPDKIADCRVHAEAFARYLSRHLAWGIFHAAFDDGNWKCDCGEPTTPEEVELAAIYRRLSPSQRRKVRNLAEQLEKRIAC